MLDMNLQRFNEKPPAKIPSELPDTPGPKLVSAKGRAERLVVVLKDDENLEAATNRVLADGNVPAVAVTGDLMTWTGQCYIGFAFGSDTKLGVYVGAFNDQGVLKITKYTATIAKVTE